MSTSHAGVATSAAPQKQASHATIIVASSAGTFFECYDFFLYGALASIISTKFFSGVNETTAYIFALMAFAAGFIVRPFGAIVFGRMGDLVGRKKTFLIAVLLMGLSTFAVGLLPTYDSIGVLAPVVLVLLRMMQGLAYGGEYGGAATYVAEHAPMGRKGFYTSFIQAMSTAGLALSLIVILSTRTFLGEETFADWGWRIPFLFSFVLLAISLWMRLTLAESPAFKRMQADKAAAPRQPLSEAFGQWRNLKFVLIALFGLVAGQSVVWYTGQFYIMFFLERLVRVDGATVNALVITGLVVASPLFVFFGWLSDRIGRKPVFFTGIALSMLLFFPMFRLMGTLANPALAHAAAESPVTVVADPADCSVQFDPVGKTAFTTSCDVAKGLLAKSGVSYTNQAAPAGSVAQIRIGERTLSSFAGAGLDAAAFKARNAQFNDEVRSTLNAAGYPEHADDAAINKIGVVLLIVAFGGLCAMVYGPMAAMLVELFPTRIRYTAMSLPYHVGNGWFGGFLPTAAFAMVAASGNIFAGIWYPVIVAGLTLVVGVLFVPETRQVDLEAT